MCIKSLTDTVRQQGLAIRELDKNLRNKPSREEIINSLNIKANNEDVFQALNNLSTELFNRPTNEEICKSLEEKLNKNELLYHLNQKPNIEDINSLINEKISMKEYKNSFNDLLHKFDLFKNEILTKINIMESNLVNRNEILNLQNELDNKANIIDVENALEIKEDKEKIFLLLQNKADKTDIDNKLDKNDFDKIINEKLSKNEFEQFLKEYDINNIFEKSQENLKNKVDISEFNFLNDSVIRNTKEMRKKIDDMDNDLDRFIESVKEQFNSLNVVINNLELNKINSNEVDIEKLKNIDNFLKNKVDQKDVEILISKAKII